MPAEALVTFVGQLVVELVGNLFAHVFAGAGSDVLEAKGRAWADRRELEKLGDDAKLAFIAGLVYVASFDGQLSPRELDEIDARMRRLAIAGNGRALAVALAVRQELAAARGVDFTPYASRIVARIPDGRPREALLRVAIAVAMKGDFSRQVVGVRRLGQAMGRSDGDVEATIEGERRRLVR